MWKREEPAWTIQNSNPEDTPSQRENPQNKAAEDKWAGAVS